MIWVMAQTSLGTTDLYKGHADFENAARQTT